MVRVMEPVTARRGWTGLTFTIGTTAAAACLAVGLLLHVLAPAAAGDPPPDVGQLIQGLVRLHSWAWTQLGVLLLLLTPPLGLLTTFLELRATDPRVAPVALVVIGVLVVAVAIALR
jgi:hypothetical protein